MSTPNSSLQDCQIIGDADLYGIGVRVAIYAQTITYMAFAANRSTPRMALEIPCLLTSYLVLGVLVLRAFQGRLRPFDTMLALFSTGTLSNVAPVEEHAVIAARKRSLGGRVMVWGWGISMTVQLLFGLWAVMKNLTLGPGQEHCHVWIYLFSKQRNDSWGMSAWRGYYWFSAIFYTLRWLYGNRKFFNSCFTFVAMKLRFSKKTRVEDKKKIEHSTVKPDLGAPPLLTQPDAAFFSQDRGAPREQPKPIPSLRLPVRARRPISSRESLLPFAAGCFWIFAFNIVGGELMIHWNRVQGINSLDASGQTMALLAGIFTLAQFGWQWSGQSVA